MLTVAPFGLEVKLEYNGLTMNDQEEYDSYVITGISGLDDADVRFAAAENPARHGEQPLPSFYGGRTIILEGFIRAKNLMKMREMQEDLRGAFGSTLTEKSLIFRTGITTSDVYINCRKNAGMAMREEQSNLRMERQFQVSLRASDPRFLSVLSAAVTQQNPSSQTMEPDNDGNWSDYPVIKFKGPLTTAEITNQLTGDIISITDSVPSGDTWTLDTFARTFKNQGGVNKYSSLDPDSTWMTIEPGENDLLLACTGANMSSFIVIDYRSSWM